MKYLINIIKLGIISIKRKMSKTGLPEGFMKIMKRTGRYLAAICFSIFMTAQPTAAKADVNQQQAPTLNVVYYNQADYPGEMIGGSTIQAAGCGPTAVAVCYSSLTGKKADVPKMCDQAYENGWYFTGQGCSHKVIPGLCDMYGLNCYGLGKDLEAVEKALRAGHPVVALMGPGDFTDNGHFVVLTRMVGKDKVKVADVGSRANTARTWSLKEVVSQGKDGAEVGGPFWEISKREEKAEEIDYKEEVQKTPKQILRQLRI